MELRTDAMWGKVCAGFNSTRGVLLPVNGCQGRNGSDAPLKTHSVPSDTFPAVADKGLRLLCGAMPFAVLRLTTAVPVYEQDPGCNIRDASRHYHQFETLSLGLHNPLGSS